MVWKGHAAEAAIWAGGAAAAAGAGWQLVAVWGGGLSIVYSRVVLLAGGVVCGMRTQP